MIKKEHIQARFLNMLPPDIVDVMSVFDVTTDSERYADTRTNRQEWEATVTFGARVTVNPKDINARQFATDSAAEYINNMIYGDLINAFERFVGVITPYVETAGSMKCRDERDKFLRIIERYRKALPNPYA